MGDPKFVKWEKTGHLGILTLNNLPENYLVNPEFVKLSQLKEWLTDNIKGLIITGAGRHFSGGADLANLLKLAGYKKKLNLQMTRGNHLLNFISELDIPVLAAISGVCFGGGLEIALACDIRICTRRSVFAFPEINHSLIPGLGGLSRLQHVCGHKNAMEILLSGDTFNANKALELKIVDQVIPEKDCLDFCIQYLGRLVKDRPVKVIRMLMRSFRNTEILTYEEALKMDVEMFCELARDYYVKG
jgi:enoyl-CoA hydratase/carnithine racemase